MKRIIFSIFLALGLMSVNQNVQAMQPAVVAQNAAHIAKSLYNNLDNAHPLKALLLAEPALLNNNAAAPDAGNPYNSWQIEPLAGLLRAHLPVGVTQPMRSALDTIVATAKPGKMYRFTAWTLSNLWNGTKWIVGHINDNRVKYLMLAGLIAFCYTSPTMNPWEHPAIVSIRNNPKLLEYWAQLKAYVCENNVYVGQLNGIAQAQEGCLANFNLGNVTGTCSSAYDVCVENAETCVESAKNAATNYNANKWFFQWSQTPDLEACNPGMCEKALKACRSCVGAIVDKSVNFTSTAVDRFLGYIFVK